MLVIALLVGHTIGETSNKKKPADEAPDNGAIVQYKCINMGDDDNPKWVHLRAMCSTNDRRYKGDYDLSVETEIEGREDAQTRMRSIHLCMKDLRELVKTI